MPVLTLSHHEASEPLAAVLDTIRGAGGSPRTLCRTASPGRTHLRVELDTCRAEELRVELARLGEQHGFEWALRTRPPRLLILVSRFGHCLDELLLRSRAGVLAGDIAGVISNHPDHRDLVEQHGLPYRHLPVTSGTKRDAEQELLSIVRDQRIDLVVLARYMQILSAEACAQLDELGVPAINIHHSLLPAFTGARPHHQALQRGVKIAGATAHYVTADLDEGPIISQHVCPVDDARCAEDIAARVRTIEAPLLAQAVTDHCEGRIVRTEHATTLTLR